MVFRKLKHSYTSQLKGTNLMYKRIVIKLSGEALASKEDLYEESTIDNIISDIITVVQNGVQVGLAIGGGNIWRGRSSNKIDKTKADQMGMLATIINSMYICEKLKERGQGAVVFTPFVVGAFTTLYSKEAALQCLNQGNIAIFGGGIGHPFFSTDTIPVLRACELNCDCVLFAKNINGVYDKNPNLYDNAVRYEKLTYRKIIQENLEAMDIAAMVLCENNNIPSVVFSLAYPNSIQLVALNNTKTYEFGTTINVS